MCAVMCVIVICRPVIALFASSIGASLTVFVTIGTEVVGGGTGYPKRDWSVRTTRVDHDPSTGEPSGVTYTSATTRRDVVGAWLFGPVPNDLAVASNGLVSKALITFDDELLVIHDLNNPSPANIEFIPSTGIWVSYVPPVTLPALPPTWVSDSAYCQRAPVVYPYQAMNGIVAGTIYPTTGTASAALLTFPLGSNPIIPASGPPNFSILAVNDPAFHTVVSDFVVTSKYNVAIRSSAPPDEPLGVASPGRDHIQAMIGAAPTPWIYTQNAGFGGAGTTFTAVDSMVTARGVAVSIGEFIPPTFGIIPLMYCHFVKTH